MMKVWVCRDTEDGWYQLFEDECNPTREVMLGAIGAQVPSGVRSLTWSCRCPNAENNGYWDHEITDELCPEMFKKFTGLPEHLECGTGRLMEWNPVCLKGNG